MSYVQKASKHSLQITCFYTGVAPFNEILWHPAVSFDLRSKDHKRWHLYFYSPPLFSWNREKVKSPTATYVPTPVTAAYTCPQWHSRHLQTPPCQVDIEAVLFVILLMCVKEGAAQSRYETLSPVLSSGWFRPWASQSLWCEEWSRGASGWRWWPGAAVAASCGSHSPLFICLKSFKVTACLERAVLQQFHDTFSSLCSSFLFPHVG